MKIRIVTAAAALLLGATACTPQEVAFWQKFHAERPAESEQLLRDLGLTDPVPAVATAATRLPSLDIVAFRDGFDATATCRGLLTLTNTSAEPYTYAAVYGPTQTPLVAMLDDTLDYPLLNPGATSTIDISDALPTINDYRLHIFLDRGMAFDVVGAC